MKNATLYKFIGWIGLGFMVWTIIEYLKLHAPWWAFITPFFGFVASFVLLVSIWIYDKNLYVSNRLRFIGGIMYIAMLIGAICNCIFM